MSAKKAKQAAFVPSLSQNGDHMIGKVGESEKAFRFFWSKKGIGQTLLAQAKSGMDISRTPLTVKRVTEERLFLGDQMIGYVYDPKKPEQSRD